MCYDSLFVTYLDTGIGAFNGLFHLQGFSTMDIWSLALGGGVVPSRRGSSYYT